MVKVQISPACPRCDKLLEELFKAGIMYDFEVLPEFVNTEYEPFYTKDSATKTYSEDWIEKHGSKKQKELLNKAKPVFEMLGRGTVAPVIEVTWNYGLTDRTIVIKGFNDKLADKGIKNIVRMILALLQAERSSSTSVGRLKIKR